MQFFPTAEGYVDFTRVGTGGTYHYAYQYKDHLGNVRMNYTYAAGKNGNPGEVKVKDESHYYPFGLKHLNYNMDYLEYQEIEDDIVLYPPLNTSAKLVYNYRYNGKELQDELGLGLYDYEARLYDPALGRWMNIDPLAEKGRRWSPYYAMDNPMYFLDPDGMLAQSFIDKLMSSSNGTTWTNNNNGSFSDNQGNSIDNDGNNIDGNGGADANKSKNSNKNGAESETDSMDSSNKESKSNESATYPDPKSFRFKSRNGWQEAAVAGLYFNVSLTRLGPNGIRIEYDFTLSFAQAILFTVPTNLKVGNTNITNEVAAESTANIVNRVIWRTAKLFVGTGATPMQVEQYFRTELKREYQMSIPGARVNFNATNYSGTPTLFRHE